ncbi:MAG TPA: protein kinase, partial [Pirellulales bacterium]|nr:protein kinase [Pirellulales bacterium]
EIVELLGKGAFGAVYRARDPQLGRVVALKIPRKGLLQNREERERFLREARAAATLHHPNICPVHDAGELDGRQYIVMALIDGQPLAKIIDRGRPLAERSAATTVRKLALALDEAHRKGIVHRDIKPSNIMIDRRGQPVVMDFGLARRYDANEATLTESGALVGTPAYMAPEQALSRLDEIGPATDVYGLGVVLYEMLTARRPFEGDKAAVLGQIAEVEPRPPSALRAGLDPRLDAICLKAIAKKTSARYGSMREFAEALREYLKAADASQAGNLLALDAPEFAGLVSGLNTQLATIAKRQRTPWWKWTAAAAAVALLVLLGWLLVPRGPLVVTNIGIDPRLLADASLSFFLDDREITARQAREPMDLAPGDHELKVQRAETLIKHYRFHVSPPNSLEMAGTPNAGDVELREVKEIVVVKAPPPAAHWDFDDKSDGAIIDVKNAGAANAPAAAQKPGDNRSQPGGVRSQPGVRGQAASFSGSGDAIAVPDDPRLHASAAVTVAAWVHPKSDRAGRIAGRWSAKGSYVLSWVDGVYSFRVAFPVGGPTGTAVGIQSLGATGEWSHVAGVYDGKRLGLYVDGQLVASQELARSELLRRTREFAKTGGIPTALQDSGQPFELGGDGFQGLLDEVQVWDAALSPDQLAALFESYDPPPPPAEVAAVGNADRRIAEWVISRGGSVVIPHPGMPHTDHRSVDDLPSEPFALYSVCLFDELSPTDEDLARLDEVPDLKSICIRNVSNGAAGLLTEEGILRFFREHPFLEQVALFGGEGLEPTDAILATLCQSTTLTYLDVRRSTITDADASDLEKLADQLLALNLVNAPNLTDVSLAHIAVLRGLTELNLSGTHVTEAGVCRLPQLLNLRLLNLWGTATGDQLLARLLDSNSLRQLGMAYTEISDAGLEHLVGIDSLRELNLLGTAISDAGVRHLKRITGLTSLDVTHTKITREGVDELRAALPRCKIFSDFGVFEPNAGRP